MKNTELIFLKEMEQPWNKLPEDMPDHIKIERMIYHARTHWMITYEEQQSRLLLEFVAARFKEQDKDKFEVFKTKLQILTNPQSIMTIDEDYLRWITEITEEKNFGKMLPNNWNELWRMSRPDLEAWYHQLPPI